MSASNVEIAAPPGRSPGNQAGENEKDGLVFFESGSLSKRAMTTEIVYINDLQPLLMTQWSWSHVQRQLGTAMNHVYKTSGKKLYYFKNFGQNDDPDVLAFDDLVLSMLVMLRVWEVEKYFTDSMQFYNNVKRIIRDYYVHAFFLTEQIVNDIDDGLPMMSDICKVLVEDYDTVLDNSEEIKKLRDIATDVHLPREVHAAAQKRLSELNGNASPRVSPSADLVNEFWRHAYNRADAWSLQPFTARLFPRHSKVQLFCLCPELDANLVREFMKRLTHQSNKFKEEL